MKHKVLLKLLLIALTFKVQIANGNDCLSAFIGGEEYITVITTEGCDMNNFTGTGKVTANKNGYVANVSFNNISLEKNGVQFYIKSGAVYGDVSDMPKKKLIGEKAANDSAYFIPDSIKITRSDYYIKGYFEYNFINPVDSNDTVNIRVKTGWIDYQDFEALGRVNFPDTISYSIPIDSLSKVRFNSGSYSYIKGGFTKFMFLLYPEIITPKDTIICETSEIFNYYTKEGLITKISDYASFTRNLTIDLSQKKSPADTSNNWTGLKWEQKEIHFNENFTGSPYNDITYSIDSLLFQSIPDATFDDLNIIKASDSLCKGVFRGFDIIIDTIKINQTNDSIDNLIHGKLNIPYVSDKENYPFSFYSQEKFDLDTAIEDIVWSDFNSPKIFELYININDSLWKFDSTDVNELTLNYPDTVDLGDSAMFYFITSGNIVYINGTPIIRNKTKVKVDTALVNYIRANGFTGSTSSYLLFAPQKTTTSNTTNLDKFLIYPTLVNDVVFIDSKYNTTSPSGMKILIVNSLGKTIYSQKLHSIPNNLNVETLPPGYYHVILMKDGEYLARQNIIKK